MFKTSNGKKVAFAGVVDRGLAWLLDGLISVLLVLIVAAVAAAIYDALGIFVLAIGIFAYYIGFEVIYGATPGKRIMGLEVRTESGDLPGWKGATLRNLTKIIGGGSILLILVGVVFISESERDQRLGDTLGATVVIERAE